MSIDLVKIYIYIKYNANDQTASENENDTVVQETHQFGR